MKKQKFSLQLRKQKISSLSQEQLNGGLFTTITGPIQTILTIQINCKSVILRCEPIYTLPSGCTSCPTTHTNTITIPTYITC